MPDPDAITVDLAGGYRLLAAGVRRERNGKLSADLILENGTTVYADRAVLNLVDGVQRWASMAATGTGRPSADELEAAILNDVLKTALAIAQAAPQQQTQADGLVELVTDLASDVAQAVELFHDRGGIAFATVPVNGHRETWPLRSKGFRNWMARRFHERHGRTPNAQALVDATGVLEGKALYDGKTIDVHVRLAWTDGVVYLDLADDGWRTVAIDAGGWRLVADPPVKFRRTRGMLPLPLPEPGGRLDELRPLLNLPAGDRPEDADDAWTLVAAWLLGAVRPRGPYPILAVHGEQGSAKSTLARALRAIIDPNKAALRTLPRDERDLAIGANNAWCLAFDNLSDLRDWQSDALCRLATGGGFATRELYSDLDETIIEAQRPVILNGIEEVATRGDLLDRAVVLYLPRIPEDRRRPESAFWTEFEARRPRLLGALLDAAAAAIANEATTVLDGHPRMADFALWVSAAESALGWERGRFLAAYRANRNDANSLALDASAVVPALRALLAASAGPVEWSWSELLAELEATADDATKRQQGWPRNGRALSGILRRLAPNLRADGIDLDFRKSNGKRKVRLSPTQAQEAVAGSERPATDDRRTAVCAKCKTPKEPGPAPCNACGNRAWTWAAGEEEDARDG